QPGEVEKTYADTSALERDFGFKPKVSIEEGLAKFVDWYRQEWRPEGKR
ncbi:protein CapI, partial [Mesorhizobium sp. M2D.F.Ca.ET.160.01.1.1]